MCSHFNLEAKAEVSELVSAKAWVPGASKEGVSVLQIDKSKGSQRWVTIKMNKCTF